MVKQSDPDSLFDETFLGFYVKYRNLCWFFFLSTCVNTSLM